MILDLHLHHKDERFGWITNLKMEDFHLAKEENNSLLAPYYQDENNRWWVLENGVGRALKVQELWSYTQLQPNTYPFAMDQLIN